MCDPLTLGSLAIGAAGTAASSIGQAKAAKKQKQEYESWAETQRTNRLQENARQDEFRKQASAAQAQGVEDLGAENQKRLQDAEATRLETALATDTGATPADEAARATADAGITGGQYGGDVYQDDFARQLSDAMTGVKNRTKALATMQSYGDSQFGLGTQNPINLAHSAADIDTANFKAKNSLGAYNIAQAVDPMQISYSNPVADIASSFLGVGMQGVGQSLAGGTGVSSIFGGALKPKVKVPSTQGGLGFGAFS
jgi:hypothetical protein